MMNYNISKIQNDDYSSAQKELCDIMCSTCCDATVISNILHDAGYQEEKIKYLITTVEKNKNELLYNILINHNSKQGETMGDFDWAVKFICGTSELKTLRFPVLELAMTTYSESLQKKRLYEFDKNMLARLIDILENSDLIK